MLLQSADGRAGAPVSGRGLSWPADLRTARREELDATPERLVEAARVAGAAALLLPGGAWDARTATSSVVERTLAAFAAFSGTVFVAPAPDDDVGPGGLWDPRALSALGSQGIPANVVLFAGPEWRSVTLPGRDDVTVTGRAAVGDATAPPRAKGRTRLLVAWEPDGARRREMLRRSGATWGAFGGGTAETILEAGVPHGADAGTPCGLSAADAGARRFLRVTLRGGSASVEAVSSDPRTIHDLLLALGVSDAENVLDRASAFLAREGVGPADLVRLTLTGPRAPGAPSPAARLATLALRVAHLEIRDRTEGADLGQAPDERHAEGRFLAGMFARRAAAEDARARRVAELALELGREALAARSVGPPPAGDDS